MESKTTFYGSRLQLARLYRGLSQAELEARTGIDRSRLYAYEDDRLAPSETDVEAIAVATSFPAAFFFRGASNGTIPGEGGGE